MTTYKYIQTRKYYYYDSYRSWREAYTVGRYYKRKYKNKYFIDKISDTWGCTRYKLYMTKVIPLT